MRRRMTNARRGDMSLDSSLTIQGWLKTEQVADYLGTSPNNVRNMLLRGHLVARKFAGRLYFKRSEIDRLIETEGA